MTTCSHFPIYEISSSFSVHKILHHWKTGYSIGLFLSVFPATVLEYQMPFEILISDCIWNIVVSVQVIKQSLISAGSFWFKFYLWESQPVKVIKILICSLLGFTRYKWDSEERIGIQYRSWKNLNIRSRNLKGWDHSTRPFSEGGICIWWSPALLVLAKRSGWLMFYSYQG